MLLVSSVLFGLLSQTIAQSTFDPYTAPTTDIGAPTGICKDENGLLSCIPQATVCPGTIPASVSSCGCTNVQTVISCYSTFCPQQLTEAEVMVLSSYSTVLCHGIGTITLPSVIPSTSGGAAPTSPVSTPAGTTSSAANLPGATSGKASVVTGSGTSTSSGGATSSTSKAAAVGGIGNTVPVMGGVLGALVGAVGLFL